MGRKSQEEVISQLFQENQVRHGEIMSIVTNQALDAILAQQVIEQIFAFAPAPTRTNSQCSQEQVPQRRFPRIIFGGRHRQYRVPPSSNHPCLTTRFISQIAYPHRLATPRLCYNDMPTPLSPGLLEKTLETMLKGGLDKAIEKRQFARTH